MKKFFMGGVVIAAAIGLASTQTKERAETYVQSENCYVYTDTVPKRDTIKHPRPDTTRPRRDSLNLQ